jgi:hypothetical protein
MIQNPSLRSLRTEGWRNDVHFQRSRRVAIARILHSAIAAYRAGSKLRNDNWVFFYLEYSYVVNFLMF